MSSRREYGPAPGHRVLTVLRGRTWGRMLRKWAKTTLQCFTVLSWTPLDGLQKDMMRFEKLAEHQHAPHHAVHAAHDHDHRRRETWWLAADGSHGHPGSSETLHKCPQVILGSMLTFLAPTTTSNLPKVAHLHNLGHDHHVGSLPQGGRSQRSGQRGICSHFAAIASLHDLSSRVHGPR